MYHYFLSTIILAYLSVSGAYRIHPGADYGANINWKWLLFSTVFHRNSGHFNRNLQ